MSAETSGPLPRPLHLDQCHSAVSGVEGRPGFAFCHRELGHPGPHYLTAYDGSKHLGFDEANYGVRTEPVDDWPTS